jgi:hypothetical protein
MSKVMRQISLLKLSGWTGEREFSGTSRAVYGPDAKSVSFCREIFQGAHGFLI